MNFINLYLLLKGNYVKALPMFEKANIHGDLQGTFQLAVILYDGLVSNREDIVSLLLKNTKKINKLINY